MEIAFSPIRRDGTLVMDRRGDVLTVNGVAYDFGKVAEGSLLPVAAVAGDWLASDVTRAKGVLRLTVFLPHGPLADETMLFPAPVHMASDGPVPVPGQQSKPEATSGKAAKGGKRA
jgi:hypothetical protein